MIPRRFEPLSCSLSRLRANIKMSNFERKYSPGYRHMICTGKTTPRSKKGVFPFRNEITSLYSHDSNYNK